MMHLDYIQSCKKCHIFSCSQLGINAIPMLYLSDAMPLLPTLPLSSGILLPLQLQYIKNE